MAPQANEKTEAVARESLTHAERLRFDHIHDMARSTSGASRARYEALAEALSNGLVWPVKPFLGPEAPEPEAPETHAREAREAPVIEAPEPEAPEPDVPVHKVERWIGKNYGMSEIQERGEAHVAREARQAREVRQVLSKVKENRLIAKLEAQFAELEA